MEDKISASPGSSDSHIPHDIRSLIKDEILAWYDHRYSSSTDDMRLSIRFRGQFCYIGSLHEPPEPTSCSLKEETREEFLMRFRRTPAPLCRLRYISPERWSVSLYNFCRDIYEPATFLTGRSEGTPVQALDLVMQVYYPEQLTE